MPSISSKRMKYTAKFKLQVVKVARESNNCVASREFGVNEKLVRDWRKQVEKLKCMPKNKCSNRGLNLRTNSSLGSKSRGRAATS